MKLYDLVKDILERYPISRDSDKRLIWEVLGRRGFLDNGVLTWEKFRDAPTFESITRARRKVQEIHPSLQASEKVREVRKQMSEGNPIDIFRNM